MSLTLPEARAEFIRAAIPVVDLNGEGPGFRAFCPACPGEIRVTLDSDGLVTHECANGCDRIRIGHALHFKAPAAKVGQPVPPVASGPTRPARPDRYAGRRPDIDAL